MDIHVRYWNESENKVTVWYWTSLFLGHTRCDDFAGAFPNGLSESEETNMIEISINGPKTNLKLFSEVQN